MMSLDTVGGFNYHNSQKKYLHIVLDQATRYAWTFPSKSVTSKTYTNCLKQIFSIQCPEQLLSVRNAAFTSSKFKKFLKHHNIRQLLTSANRPQCNGKNERVNQTLVAKLRCKVNSTIKICTKLLEQVTYEYNNSPHDVTGFPPAYLMFGTLPYDSPLPNQVKLNYPPTQQARQIAVNRTIKHHKINKQSKICARVQRNSSTVMRVWKQWTDEHRTNRKTGSGQRKVTSACNDRHLLHMAVNDRTTSSRQLAARWSTATGILMSASSIRQRLLYRRLRARDHDGCIRVRRYGGERRLPECVIERHSGLTHGVMCHTRWIEFDLSVPARDLRPAASKDELLLRIQAIWNFLPQADIENLFDSMPRRIAALNVVLSGYSKAFGGGPRNFEPWSSDELALLLLTSTPPGGCLSHDIINGHQPPLHGGSSAVLESNSRHAGCESITLKISLLWPVTMVKGPRDEATSELCTPLSKLPHQVNSELE
ncbi:retrotransposable element Tf2 protein type 1 [Trichonephila clavipes]|nr:retrotransposable element Tf2 protein type 1 [Trichonephila clavipes]